MLGDNIMTTVRFKIPDLLDRIFIWPVLLYRLCKYGYTFRRIYLGDNIWTIVDPADYYSLSNFNWYYNGNGSKFYAIRSIKVAPGKTKMVSMHRQLMQDQLDAALRTQNSRRNNLRSKLLVDHINNDPLDNRRANLRLATWSQNMRNRPKTKTKTSSKYIGVCFEKRICRWTVKIRTNGKRYWIGTFKSEIEAAKAYDRAARKYHGEFAKLNFE